MVERKKEGQLQKQKNHASRVRELHKRRTARIDGYEEVIYERVGDVQLPSKTFHQKLQYDFLQYVRIAFKWACETHSISRPHLELLLYIYPIGLFKRTDIEVFTKTIDMKYTRVFRTLEDDGWITLWRQKKGKQAALYTLSTKARILCGKLHKICTGESEIPESKYNPLVNSEKVIDKYYLNVIKKMNTRDMSKAQNVEKES